MIMAYGGEKGHETAGVQVARIRAADIRSTFCTLCCVADVDACPRVEGYLSEVSATRSTEQWFALHRGGTN